MTENEIELFAIELLEKLGFEYIYAPSIAPDSETPMRESFEDVILKEKLQNALAAINPTLDYDLIEYAVKQCQRLRSTELLTDNELFHKMLTEGVKVEVQKDGVTRGEIVKLIDFDDVSRNNFVVSNQLTIVENGINKRPDLILFVNGLPLVVAELKNPVDENATIKSAYNQIQTYKSVIPSLFAYNAFCIISDGLEAKAGTISAGLTRFMSWKSSDGRSEASKLISRMETLVHGMLNPTTLLDLIRNFIVYEKNTKVDSKTQITTIETVKKLAAYHQYYAVNKAVERTTLASSINGDKKGGVVWHTQGSGKSLSMVFYTGKVVLSLNNPTILVITDRNDLDDQLFDTFASSQSLLRQEPIQAQDRDHLKTLLKVASGGVIFATIQKFSPEEGNIYDELSDRRNIIVIADEAHRTQYGFKPKTVDDKDKDGNVIGKKIVYGFAKYLRDALPNATYLGFTGTPIENTDVNTPAVFGDYVDIYDISQAVEDGATVKIYYESRLAKITLSDEGKKLVKELDDELGNDDLSETQKAKAKWTQLEALIGSENRVNEVANDIVTHFENRQEVFDGKGMIVAMSRRIATRLYEEIIKLRPEWHSDDLSKGVIKVIMTASSSDGPQMAKHHTTKQQRRDLANRMKDTNDELKLVIVRDMWLTGFDAPSMHTLYIDKPMKGHNLMQAIARVNRVYKDKPGGLVVDYLGLASDLKKALSFYSDSGGKGDPALAQEQAVALMLEKLEVVSQMYHGFAYENYFEADTRVKLSLILEAEEHILGLEDGKKRYIDEVTALSSAFAIAVPHDEAMDVKDEVSFFQAVKARLVKFESTGGGRTDEELETTIRQVIDKALVTEQVIDIFDASGIKKPDISVLSEEFLLEVKGMKHKNIALEVLKKLLNDEIKTRMKTNLVQSKSLMEMLENSIKKYHNKIITAAEVIEELINLSKDIHKMDEEPKAMGLTDFEYAFYTAVANNDSAKDLMSKDVLRELAVVLTERVRANASIDWTIKESVRAKLKVIVKRTLRQFGYPPDMQMLATETVLKQAEMIANELTGEK
ncbi:MAG: type I restriction endonuclease subunit R [Epsilonproteobacteria bacterium]|nr:type I restriction endonuclease subunit R [Campylobacterota bacterium]OIO16991.1 MAG: DEAD/DEAH box helicase [Helicobacteraceae bacterium CG1_02_36_14]PIP11318.1 MAG: DEAD/DEAH box helicase [Sulfurimonas sp. CG23_combo_of_CG06-09_8_20_14_all_36_33]PIS25877.1 MAG: DEAD/DEAH box helicase [Sulfurimonas sp. CG08_land_8_20_14_0_20_36_33]PIU33636.1 MAG: DEAD/DEAH box helicase [Sulfurimonas sp. CG07_land_8_20_14_0_80_36_56]PIV04243.1 MAG: DEAD/DEAH box helicase [Sulfurimonas sp. CG03_land_8_20_14_